MQTNAQNKPEFPDTSIIDVMKMAMSVGKVWACNGRQVAMKSEPLEAGWHKIGVSILPTTWECPNCGWPNSDESTECGRCGNG